MPKATELGLTRRIKEHMLARFGIDDYDPIIQVLDYLYDPGPTGAQAAFMVDAKEDDATAGASEYAKYKATIELKVAEFVHPKLKSIEAKLDVTNPLQKLLEMSDEELNGKIKQVAARVVNK